MLLFDLTADVFDWIAGSCRLTCCNQGRVIRKPVHANTGANVKWTIIFFYKNCFSLLLCCKVFKTKGHFTAKLQNPNQNSRLSWVSFFEQPSPGALLLGLAKSTYFFFVYSLFSCVGHIWLKARLTAQTFKMAATHCCLPLCTNDSKYNKEVSFHAFPKEAKRRAEWIVRTQRDPGQNFEVSSNCPASCSNSVGSA